MSTVMHHQWSSSTFFRQLCAPFPTPPVCCTSEQEEEKGKLIEGSSRVQPRMPPHHTQNFNNLYNIHGIVLIICVVAPSSIVCTINTSKAQHLSSSGFDIDKWLQRFRTNKEIPLLKKIKPKNTNKRKPTQKSKQSHPSHPSKQQPQSHHYASRLSFSTTMKTLPKPTIV